jgi:hypothetical protein
MKGLKIFLLVTAGCLLAGSLSADIYEWTDNNGVKHFTNYAPPDDATILIKSEELPYDEAADRARIEADRQHQLEIAKLEIAEREAELARREAETEQRAAEAERYAEETVRAADQYLEDSRNDRWYYRGGAIWGGYRPPHSRRSFYRNETASIYWVNRPYIDHYKRNYRKKSRYGHSMKSHGSRYGQKKHAYPQTYQSPRYRSLRTGSAHGAYRGNSRSRGPAGRSHSRGGSNGLRR